MTQPLENRISALEARLEFQDETIAALNEALVVQQQRYFELDRAFKLLTRRLREQKPESPFCLASCYNAIPR